MSDIHRLQKAIRDLHGVESSHLRSEPVHETDPGGLRYVAVLGVPPVNSAQEVVRAAIVAETQRARGGRT